LSKTVKCPACGSKEDERCVLMRVVVKKDGEKTYYCCENLQEEKKKEI
jgi:hypothetical protein